MEKTDVIKLLAIDDKPDNLTTLIAVVQDALPKTLILTATNGPAAIELAAAEDPDVILLDIVMPGMDGFEVCRRLKAYDRLKDIPVVFLTALKTDIDSRVKALEVGGEGFLAKPLETAELTAQIRAMTKVKAANRSQRTEKTRLQTLVAERTADLQETMEALRTEKANLSAIFELAPVPMLILDETTNILAANKAVIDLCGCDKSLVIHHRSGDSLHCANSDAAGCGNGPDCPLCPVSSAIVGMIAGNSGPINAEIKRSIIRKNKEQEIWLKVSIAELLLNEKRAFCVSLVDITERKKAEEKIRSAHQYLRSTVDGLSAHIVVLDEHGKIILTNKSYRDFGERNGIEPSTVSEGANYLAVCDAASGEHSEQAKPFAEGLREVISGKRKSFELEYPCHSPDEKRWFIVRVTTFSGKGSPLVIIAHENISEQKRAEERRQEGADLLKKLACLVPGVIYQYRVYPDGHSNFPYSSPGMYDIYEVTPEEVREDASVVLGRVHPDDLERVSEAISESARTLNTFQCELRVVLPKQGLRWRWSQAHPERTEDGGTIWHGIILDITGRKHTETEREKLQAQLNQSQKMESVGRLAGGVAHDFNNLLMGIMGYVDLCKDAVGKEGQVREWLDEITREAQRSANITRQLLAFARKQTMAPQVIDLNDAVGNMLKMLLRLIGEDIDLVWQPGSEPWSVKIDPGQVDQILANLCVNARDAIGGAGKITIETENITIDANDCAEQAEAEPGSYVRLAVSDDGCGMDHETLKNIFEPFFTTKPTGEGTGLGLATVYGIVKQNSGFINVYSEPGKGTTFRIYLPCATSVSKMATEAATKTESQGGTETILLVEDENSIRFTLRMFLERFGYTVIAAESPAVALRLAAEHRDGIDLMITDVVMPGMSGRELATKLTVDHPSMKILYMSGYTADVIAHRGILEDGVQFIGKPIGRDALVQKVREVLG